MNRKNGIVYVVTLSIISILSGCFPWNEEKPIDTKQEQTPDADLKSATSQQPLQATIGQPHIGKNTTAQNIISPINEEGAPPIKRSSRSTRRLRRKEKKEKKVAPKKSIPKDKKLTESSAIISEDNSLSMQDKKLDQTITTTQQHTQVDTKSMRSIDIRHDINPNLLAVKHWTGTYTPTKLIISVNTVPFIIAGNNAEPHGTIKKIPCNDNQLKITYEYEFLNGMRKGSDAITYTITETNSSPLTLHFSWDTPWHVELNGAQRI